MRINGIAMVAATALVLAVPVLAATTTKDPNGLILQKKDFPAHSDYDGSPGSDGFNFETALSKKGFDAGIGGFLGESYSQKKGMLIVRGAVLTTTSPAKAKQAFAIALKARQSLWKVLGTKYMPFGGVPHYGDQQLAFAKKPSVVADGSIDVLVRKHAVVWVLEVVITNRQPPPPMSEVVGDLKTYAAKQQRRIGPG